MIIIVVFGVGIWVLVNNVGVVGSVGFVDWFIWWDYEVVMLVNLYGMIDMINVCLLFFRKEKGCVVNMISICGRIILVLMLYCVFKYVVEVYLDCLRYSVWNILVNVLFII